MSQEVLERSVYILFIILSIILFMYSPTEAASLSVQSLKCEYLVDPCGVDKNPPRLSWMLESDQRGVKQSAYHILVASSVDQLAMNEGELWDSGKIQSDETINIPYGGKSLQSRQRCYWKVRVWDENDNKSPWSQPACWSMGLLKRSDWKAQWISFKDDSEFTASPQKIVLPPARYYRKTFTLKKPIKHATVYTTALGIYELHLNGHKVSNQMFTPGWSDYKKRVYYNTFDVTSQLSEGKNVVGTILADGWYSGYLGYALLVGYGPDKCGRYIYGKTPAFLMQLEIEYEDGTTKRIITDPSWKVNTGPILQADMLMGETYDARLQQKVWDQTGFDDNDWDNAILAQQNDSLTKTYYDKAGAREVELGFVEPQALQAYPSVPIQITEEIKPVNITETEEGVYIFNMGQNFSGVVRLKAKGLRGTKIKLRHGEMLHPDGRLMTENLRRARATDTYILRGDEDFETWAPRFTYHGFQYVEVRGLQNKPTLDTLTGLVIHSDTPLTSSFECSDQMVNQLFENVVWTQRSNFFEVPTDCPQRDERFGWTGDAQIYVGTATYNADVAAFFTKWLDDLEEAQLPNGAFPDYAPYPMMHGKPNRGFATAWMDAGIICPYTIHKVYNDHNVIKRHYASMKRFMDFREKNSPDFLGVNIGNGWGDWLSLGSPTPIEYIDTVYFAKSARLMAEMADAIGEQTDAKHYHTLYKNIKNAFADKYINEKGLLTIHNQTAYALALSIDLIPNSLKDQAANQLADLIRDNEYRMSTGFLGTRPLLPVLSQHGYNDLAVRLLQSRRFPSWGYEIENGATTVWERWNSYVKDEGFANVSMNSFSHYAFGAVCEWMFKTLAGIDTASEGYKKIVIHPHPPKPNTNPENKPIQWVKAKYRSSRGTISCYWRNETNQFVMGLTIPANTTAEVHIPGIEKANITEKGQPIHQLEEVTFLRQEDNDYIYNVKSGSYIFISSNSE